MKLKFIFKFILGYSMCSMFMHKADSSSLPSQIIAAYWGQNSVHHKTGIVAADYEKPLVHFCTNSPYNIILISFMHVFYDSRNKDNFPSINLANHCSTTVSSEYPGLLACPATGAAVKVCQRNNKKVLLSLGGATGNYGFIDNAQAVEFANRVWNLFLGGTQYSATLRPFGNSILDGIDLDIENKNSVGYTAFTNKLRSLMATDYSRSYLITAAPQCPFPDKSLGPSKEAVLGTAGHQLDYLFVQYYNNFCYPGESYFGKNLQQWLDWSESVRLLYDKSPKIVVGLPAGVKAAFGNQYFMSVEKTREMIMDIREKDNFGGIMFWDAGFDQNEITNGKTYSEQIKDSLLLNGPTSSSNQNHLSIISLITSMTIIVLIFYFN